MCTRNSVCRWCKISSIYGSSISRSCCAETNVVVDLGLQIWCQELKFHQNQHDTSARLFFRHQGAHQQNVIASRRPVLMLAVTFGIPGGRSRLSGSQLGHRRILTFRCWVNPVITTSRKSHYYVKTWKNAKLLNPRSFTLFPIGPGCKVSGAGSTSNALTFNYIYRMPRCPH